MSKLFTFFDFEWSKTDTFCKFYTFIRYSNVQFCAWLLVLNSVDRLLTIYYATRSTAIDFIKRFLNDFKFQLFVIASIFIIIIIINIPFIIYSTYFESTSSCGLPGKYEFIIQIPFNFNIIYCSCVL